MPTDPRSLLTLETPRISVVPMSNRTVTGYVVTPTESVLTSTTFNGSLVMEKTLTFDREVTAEEVLGLFFLRSFLGCGLFEGPAMSPDNRKARFWRKEGV